VAIDNARRFAVLAALAALLAACGQQGGSAPASKQAAQPTQAAAPIASDLKPLPGHEKDAPPLTKKSTVRMQTTAGELVIDVFPDAAPHAAQRFLELVSSGFYDDTPISRVVPGFVAQFGVNWREPHKAWKDKTFDDDPSYYALERGTLAFAKAGPNTNSTQVFINYRENNRLADPSNNFTAFGEVVSGMDVVDKFARVGDPSYGLDQNRLWQDGGAYLDSLTEKPTMIQHAEVVGAAK
jgi:cyclophilin family peptidyl-prolyl cis-trans isomerase/predicted small lipoprotein YifL